MRFRSWLVLPVLIWITGSCEVSKRKAASHTLDAKDLKVYGRYYVNDRQQLAMVSSAVHFGFSFTGKECRLQVSLPAGAAHNYLQYELDGSYQKRIRINGNQSVVIPTNGPGQHGIWIYKATEAHTGDIFIEKIEADHIRPLESKASQVIEFIGNSITCGAAADTSEVACGKGTYHDQHNAYLSYGPRVARALGTEFVLSSVSGIGIYRNWNSEGPAMPEVYEKLDFQAGSNRIWDFRLVQPAVVSIALGTNDFSNGDGKSERLPFDSAKFTARYTAFVRKVKSVYPRSKIALLNSPMVHGSRNAVLQDCLQRVKEAIDQQFSNDAPVSLFFFPPMQAGGCTGHPSVADHAKLAEQLLPFMRSLLTKR